MFVAITNTPRPYAWGSTSAIADLLGHTPSGRPEAELWLGAHPGSPSVIVDPSTVGGARNLVEWIAADPETTLGRFASTGRLPFLLKILAAAHPLSLQAHPTPSQAAAGFERENALGVPLDAAHRNYKDASAKPELIYALSDTFDALCGFRPLEEVRSLLELLLDLDAATEEPQPQPLEDLLAQLASEAVVSGGGSLGFGGAGSGGAGSVVAGSGASGSGALGSASASAGSAGDTRRLRSVFEWLISSGPGVPTLVSLVTRLAPLSAHPSLVTAAALAGEYPDDPGIVISLLINRVTLARGEALYLPAGNIHAYLEGLGVELMAASDNVLRGGLTPKHIDVPELLGVLDFTPVPVPYLRADGVAGDGADARGGVDVRGRADAESPAGTLTPSASDNGLTPGPAPAPPDGIEVFRPSAPDFVLVRVSGAEVSARYSLNGPAIAICTTGDFVIGGEASSIALGRGESVYVTPDERELSFAGSGELFLATTGE